jgi:hypothetical protein
MPEYSGHCACGAVRWIARDSLTRCLVCHCEDCRRALSSPLMASMGFQLQDVSCNGEMTAFESTPGTLRDFCPACGTRMTYRSDKWPDEVHIMAATLDDPSLYYPDAQVVVAEEVCWLKEIAGAERYPGFHMAPKA